VRQRTVTKVVLASALAVLSTGCLGTGALGRKVKEFNLEVVENRYGREAVFLGLQIIWIYRICAVLDLFVFNSIEFWSGTNPINGKNALADIPLSAAEEISLRDVERAQVERVSDSEAKLIIDFANGDHLTFDVTRDGDAYTVHYMDRVFYHGHVGGELAEGGDQL
jgi:hypothetical protein